MQDSVRYFLVTIALVLFTIGAQAQDWRLKTNVAYLATATPNLAVEHRFAEHWSWDLSAGWNTITFSGNKKWKHVAIQPEARYWLQCPFKGHFFGAHLLYSHFNAGGIKMPFGMFSELEQHRFQGDLGGVGIAYGYNWTLGKQKRWAIEAEIGVGYVYAHYNKYRTPEKCASLVGVESKHLFIPTKLNIAVVYNFGKTDRLKNCCKSVVYNDYAPSTGTDTPMQYHANQPNSLPYDKDSKVELVAAPTNNGSGTDVAQSNNGSGAEVAQSNNAQGATASKNTELADAAGAARQREYVYFPISSSEINRNYSGNGASLDRILNRITEVRKDGDAIIKKIRIIGLASIDGPTAYNARIALARAKELAKYLQVRTALPMSVFETVNGGEGWEDLRRKVEQASEAELPQKQAILSIIDSETDLDRREQRLKRLDNGSVWAEMKDTEFVRSQRIACVVEINP